MDRILVKELEGALSSLRSDIDDALSNLEEYEDFPGKDDVLKLVDSAFNDIDEALFLVSKAAEDD